MTRDTSIKGRQKKKRPERINMIRDRNELLP